MKRIAVTLLQVGYADEEPIERRVGRVCSWIRDLHSVDLIMLPDLWAQGGLVSGLSARKTEFVGRDTIRRLAEAARDVGAWVHAGFIIEKADDEGEHGPMERGLWDASVLLSPHGKVHRAYRNIHRFGFGKGARPTADSELVVADLDWRGRSARIGLATCYDLRFPELFRHVGEHGAEVVLSTTAWPMPRIEQWRLLGRARALENQSWVLQCNSAGTHRGVAMGGRSHVVAPTGEVIAELGREEGQLATQLDLDLD